MSTTLKTIVEREALILAGTNTPVNFLATSGSTTTGVSTSASPNKTAATAYNGVELLVTRDAGGSNAAPENESRIVTLFTSGTSTWTVTQPFTAAIASGDSLTLLYRMGYTSLLDSINTIVRNLPLPRWLPLTLVPDGDMEDASDEWNDVGTATVTKVQTASRTLLKNALRIQTAGDGNGARSDAFPVHEGELLFVSVALSTDTGTAQIELYDEDAAAVISGESYTSDEEGIVMVAFQYTVQTDVERISVQITQDGATSMDAFVAFASVLSSRQRVYNLTAKPWNIEGLEFLREGTNFENDSSTLWERKLEPWPIDGFIRDQFGANPNRIQMALPRCEGPLFLRFRQTDTVLDSMEDTLYIDGDELEAFLSGVDAEVYKRLADQARSQGNVQLEIDYMREARVRGRTYRNLLDSMGLAQPIVRSGVQRRVAV